MTAHHDDAANAVVRHPAVTPEIAELLLTSASGPAFAAARCAIRREVLARVSIGRTSSIGSRMAPPIMMRLVPLVLALSLAVGLPVGTAAAAGVGGTWRVQFVVPSGTKAVNMNVVQKGVRLSGVITDEYGEYPIDGRLDGDRVTIVWTIPEDGKLVDITMKGKLEGDVINGTATIGDLGEGPLQARRTADE
jgi:hypothetical protein